MDVRIGPSVPNGAFVCIRAVYLLRISTYHKLGTMRIRVHI